jgi:hypothetical protein
MFVHKAAAESGKSNYFFTCPFGMSLVKGFAATRVVNVCVF